MKKFHKIGSSQVINQQIDIQNKPKFDLTSLLPKILKILPQITQNFASKSENHTTKQAPMQTLSREDLMREENKRSALAYIQQHQNRIHKIKEQNLKQ